MTEITLITATVLVFIYAVLDWWLITPRYFTPVYIAASALAVMGFTL